jgi:leukotriene-A4 hydrolase
LIVGSKESAHCRNTERTLGGLDVFLPYVKDYVSTYQGKSITTEIWKDHLYAYFRKHGGDEKVKALDSVNWDAWLFGEGLELPVKMEYDDTLATQAYSLAARWDKERDTPVDKLEFKASDVETLNSNQKSWFDPSAMRTIDSSLNFSFGSCVH